MALQVFIDERTPSSRQDAVSEAQLMHLDHFMWITYQRRQAHRTQRLDATREAVQGRA